MSDDIEDGDYIDDSGEPVRRKATIGDGRSTRGSYDRNVQDRKMILAEQFREMERRFPDGCKVQLPDQQIQVVNVVPGANDCERVVRYHVIGDHARRSKQKLRIHRMSVLGFLRMVKDAKAENLSS